jgi:hypothetical protein
MNFEELVKFLRDNWPALIAIIIIVTPVVWIILHFLYNHRFNILKDEIDALRRKEKDAQPLPSKLSVQIQLHRPFDREPSDHLYGEPFDSAADRLVGGAEKWSSPRQLQPGNPRAVVPGTAIVIELHENGPLLDFSIQNIDQVPNYLNAVASIVSAWIAARARRKQELPKDDFRNKGGTVIRVGDLRIESERNLETKELQRLVSAVATTAADRTKSADA